MNRVSKSYDDIRASLLSTPAAIIIIIRLAVHPPAYGARLFGALGYSSGSAGDGIIKT